GEHVDEADIDGTLKRLGAARQLVESALRDSSTPTVVHAGYKVNVVPEEAVAYVDGRLLPGATEPFFATVDELLGRGIERDFVYLAPSLEVPVDTTLFSAITAALHAEDSGGVVVPYCMSGFSDAKAFSRLGISSYGFTPVLLPEGVDYRSLVHGIDERVPIAG